VIRRALRAWCRWRQRSADPLAEVIWERLMWEQSGGALIAADRAGRIVRINAAARELVGASAATSPGESVLRLFAPAAREALAEELVAARLSLVAASAQGIKNGLGLLGIGAPERM